MEVSGTVKIKGISHDVGILQIDFCLRYLRPMTQCWYSVESFLGHWSAKVEQWECFIRFVISLTKARNKIGPR